MKILMIVVFLFSICAFAEGPEAIVKKYLGHRSSEACFDCDNPYRAKVVALGSNATPFLLKALENKSLETEAVYVLGQIGDPKAFSALLKTFKQERRPTAKWRVGISLGSSLSKENIKIFTKELSSTEGLKILKEISSQDFGDDMKKWEEWLFANMQKAIEYCKERSAPLLG
jgi:hypothetical protein